MSSIDKTIGIIGGTGPLGAGLAYRWALAGSRVVIGSRRVEAAHETAARVARTCGASHADRITGRGNEDCAREADFLVISVPWEAHDTTLQSIADHAVGKVVLDVVSPLEKGRGGMRAKRVEAGSASESAQNILPESRIVGGFHHVSAVKLGNVDLETVNTDVMLVGNDADAVSEVSTLVELIPGMRGIYAGKLESAAAVEGLTANLIAANRKYKTHAGIRVTGV